MSKLDFDYIQAALRGGLEFKAQLVIIDRPNDPRRPMMPANKLVSFGPRSKWRFVLPYGRWLCKDGTEFLFDRRYCALWQRSPDGFTTPSRNIWVRNIAEEFWFFDDDTAPWYENQAAFESLMRSLRALTDFGINPDLAKLPRVISEAWGECRQIMADKLHVNSRKVEP